MNILQLGRLLNAFWSEQEGVTSIEYALLATLIFGAIIIGVGLLGEAVGQMYDDIAAMVIAAIG